MPRAKSGVKTTVRRAKETAQTEAVRRKQAQAVELRKSGATLQQIADALGYASPSGAAQAIKAAIDRIGREPAADLLELELQRLDTMQTICWKNLLAGDTSEVGNILRIMEKRHRLTGLEQTIDARFSQQNISINFDGSNVQVSNTSGVMVIEGTSEQEYIASLAQAMGLTPEEVMRLKPGDNEDPKPIAAIMAGRGEETDIIEDAQIIEDTSVEQEEED